MSIYTKGLEGRLKSQYFKIKVSSKHPLIQLANQLDWQRIYNIALPDLQQTSKGLWMLGRRLYVRIHLAVMILQCLLKETDRGLEQRIMDTPVLQLFTGNTVVGKWRCPDHTKIEEFRNRLSPETHKAIGDYVVEVACSLGFADPSWMDLDSTVQEANMAYPSDATLMRKLALKATKVLNYIKTNGKKYLPSNLHLDMKKINKKAMGYFFMAKNIAIEKKREHFQKYYKLVKKELSPMLNFLDCLSPQAYKKLPWHIRQSIDQLKENGRRYLLDVGHFVRTHTIKPGKKLALHLGAVACIRKGKVGKDNEFGRVFQIGRIGGNFLIPFTSTSVRMEDKKSLIPAIREHQKIFGAEVLQSISTDKGYFSAHNVSYTENLNIDSTGIQRPSSVKDQLPQELTEAFRDRRAGIEPLIGHAKRFGLGKSKMKSDESTLSSGYRSIMGFNLHQLIRNLTGQTT